MSEVIPEIREEPVRSATRSESNASNRDERTEREAQAEAQGALRVASSKGVPSSSLQRTASALRTAVPLLQKLLPLLDGNVAAAVVNLLAPRLQNQPVVNLAPLETSLMKLRGEIAVVQDKNAQHDVAFKRIDDQLESMKEAVERTTAEQREVAEEVSRVRKSVLVFSLIGVGLLVVSIGLNAALFLFVKGILR